MKDDGGFEVGAGDTITFSYGIPPVGVEGKVIDRARELIVLTPGHNPPEVALRLLRRHVAGFYKEHKQSSVSETGTDDGNCTLSHDAA